MTAPERPHDLDPAAADNRRGEPDVTDPPQDGPDPIRGAQGGADRTEDSAGSQQTRPADLAGAGGVGADRDLSTGHPHSVASDGASGQDGVGVHDGGGRDHPDTASGGRGDGEREPLVPQQRAHDYLTRWEALKGGFVDEPTQAVGDADRLVTELLDELQHIFRSQRENIERGMDTDETSTEDLRMALRRYRSFFDRLLSI